MALEKLQIILEKPGGAGSEPVFDNSQAITVLFNPERLVFSKSANWAKQDPKDHDNPELQFNNSEPRTLSLDLLFDTYDTASLTKTDVRDRTKKITKLIIVDSDKHRPPVCRLAWGSVGVFFQGVLERLEQQFILFTEDGKPVRAKLGCTFKEWRTNYEDLRQQNLQSSDMAKTRVLKRGESLSSIAAEEYCNPGLWRPIAIENGIDDPRALTPGMILLIPAVPEQYST
jgi:nucleoid-associated protein YgaU